MEDEQATGLAGGYDLVGYSSFTRNLEKRFEEKMVIVSECSLERVPGDRLKVCHL